MDIFLIIIGIIFNCYQLDIFLCIVLLDVEEFSGIEKLSEFYYYIIMFISVEKNIDVVQFLSKFVMLMMGGGVLQQLVDCKCVYGVVIVFWCISSLEDQLKYQIIFEFFFFLLDKQFCSYCFFVNKLVLEVVEQVLQEYYLYDWEYEFNFK